MEERLEYRLECGGAGGSPFTVPGQGMATETSRHWNCSNDLVLTMLLFAEAELCRCSSRFHTYTCESSLADITYLPSWLNEAAIWLLVFLKPVVSESTGVTGEKKE